VGHGNNLIPLVITEKGLGRPTSNVNDIRANADEGSHKLVGQIIASILPTPLGEFAVQRTGFAFGTPCNPKV
jgi:hypothetical protein